MDKSQLAPSNEEAIQERLDMFKLIEQSQQQILIAQQRVAFLNGVLAARGVNPDTEIQSKDLRPVTNQIVQTSARKTKTKR